MPGLPAQHLYKTNITLHTFEYFDMPVKKLALADQEYVLIYEGLREGMSDASTEVNSPVCWNESGIPPLTLA
jgi:hypothetical protein